MGYLCVFGPTVGSGGLGFRTLVGALQHGSLHVLKCFFVHFMMCILFEFAFLCCKIQYFQPITYKLTLFFRGTIKIMNFVGAKADDCPTSCFLGQYLLNGINNVKPLADSSNLRLKSFSAIANSNK